MPGCGEERQQWWLSPCMCDSMSIWLPTKGILHCGLSLLFHQAISLHSTAVLTPGLLSLTHLSLPAPMCTSGSTSSPRYVRLHHGLSLWFLLYSDCHVSVASPFSDSLKCFVSVSINLPGCGSLSLLQLPHSQEQISPVCSFPSLYFLSSYSMRHVS